MLILSLHPGWEIKKRSPMTYAIVSSFIYNGIDNNTITTTFIKPTKHKILPLSDQIITQYMKEDGIIEDLPQLDLY